MNKQWKILPKILAFLLVLLALGCDPEDKKVFHTVTFNAGAGTFAGGEKTIIQKVEHGSRATAPETAPTSTKNSHQFADWYTDSEGKTKFNFDHPITAAKTLYGKYKWWARGAKVLLINIDGLQYGQIKLTDTPNLDKFTIKKGFTGGVYGTETQQETFSGPGLVTIFTGVWADKHKIKNNYAKQICKRESIFGIIRKYIPESYIASISAWDTINYFLVHDMYKVDYLSTVGGGADLSTYSD